MAMRDSSAPAPSPSARHPDPGPADPPPSADPEITAERAYLAASRAALRRMLDDVLATETMVGDAVVDKYTNAVLRRARAKRAEQLTDLPDVPLFFGRLDFEAGAVFEPDPAAPPAAADATGGGDRVHIGRRHVHDEHGRAMVLDWRARLSHAFYQAAPHDPMKVRTRRRYGFDHQARLTAYEDEDLTAPAPQAPTTSTLLATEIERPRSGPMRDIVATIQPEQDDLVRAPLETTVCVQGAPGTGKTAVGLHRIAYLLYAHRERLARSGVAIIGPNRSFLTYIRNVLPALGEVDVAQATIDDLLDHAPARRTEDPEAARIKGDARMAPVIARALWSHLKAPTDTLTVHHGARRHRLYPEDLAELQQELRDRGVTYGAGRELLAHRIAHTVMSRMEATGQACDERTPGQIRRTREVKAAVAALWPKADPRTLIHALLTDPERLARAADGVLTPAEQTAILLPGTPRGPKSARWSPADLALIDEAAHLIERRSGLGHIVIDEAQDLSAMQCRAIARRAAGSMTVLGDLAQATAPAAPPDWPALLGHLGRPEATLAVLERGYRVPAQIIDYAARLLPRIAPHLGTPTAIRQAPGALRISPTDPDALTPAITTACTQALEGQGSIGLIAADTDTEGLHQALTAAGVPCALLGADQDALETHRLVCVPAALAKGLEFDTVILAEPARIAEAEPRGLHRLYVVLTRAVSALHIVHARPLPEPLR